MKALVKSFNAESHLSITLLFLLFGSNERVIRPRYGVKTSRVFLCFGVMVSLLLFVSILRFHCWASLAGEFYLAGTTPIIEIQGCLSYVSKRFWFLEAGCTCPYSKGPKHLLSRYLLVYRGEKRECQLTCCTKLIGILWGWKKFQVSITKQGLGKFPTSTPPLPWSFTEFYTDYRWWAIENRVNLNQSSLSCFIVLLFNAWWLILHLTVK